MSKKNKVLLISFTGVLALVLTWFLFTMSIRSEFKNHLSKEYPGERFAIGFIIYEPLYENYCANVTCLDNHIHFGISKSSNIKEISDDYSGFKYNSKIKSIFDNSNLKNAIVSVTGTGSSHFKDDGVYTQINLTITENSDMVSVVTKTITMLSENNISADIVYIQQEKDKHVYELSLSPADYSLSKSELEAKIEHRK